MTRRKGGDRPSWFADTAMDDGVTISAEAGGSIEVRGRAVCEYCHKAISYADMHATYFGSTASQNVPVLSVVALGKRGQFMHRACYERSVYSGGSPVPGGTVVGE